MEIAKYKAIFFIIVCAEVLVRSMELVHKQKQHIDPKR